MSEARAGLEVEADLRKGAFRLDVRLDVADGAVLAVLGPNGSGKSTLLDAIGGLQVPERGTIAWRGRVLSADGRSMPPAKRRFGLLRQDPLLFPHRTVRQNVAFGPRARRWRDADARADRWLERLGVEHLAERRADALSGGQAARVAIARALAADPEVLLLDEPLAALDAEAAPEVRQVLAEVVRASAITTVLVSHDVLDAAMLADDVVVLRAGEVVERGTRAEVLGAPRTSFTAALVGINLVPAGFGGLGGTPGGRVRFRPSDVSIAAERSWPTNTWQARVRWLEPATGGVRVRLAPVDGDGPDVLADVDPVGIMPAGAEHGWLRQGSIVWAHVAEGATDDA